MSGGRKKKVSGLAENVSKSERTVSTGAAVAGNSVAAGNSGNGGGSDVRQSGYFLGVAGG